MASSSEIILSNQVHPGDSTATTATGDNFKGDGYYGRSDGFHSVQYSLDGFIGKINMQATLAVEPTDTDWFTLSGTEHTSATEIDVNGDGGFIYNFTGNYVWVRAYISNWTDGTVSNILLNH
tara:strand:- start:687 stop:1052 length:366 start_codon:yes stop_codon:yes gene_type:complete